MSKKQDVYPNGVNLESMEVVIVYDREFPFSLVVTYSKLEEVWDIIEEQKLENGQPMPDAFSPNPTTLRKLSVEDWLLSQGVVFDFDDSKEVGKEVVVDDSLLKFVLKRSVEQKV